MNKKNNTIEHKKGEKYLKNRPDIKEIEKEIISLVPLKEIGLKYDCSASSLSRYKNKYLIRKCNASQANKDLKEGEELLDYLESHIRNVTKLSNACMEQLIDPEDPEKLFLGARSDEITVTYIDRVDDKTQIKRKEKLQVLINRLNQQLNGYKTTINIEINTTDRAHTLIAASNALNKHIHLFAELAGKLGNTTINITNQPVFIALVKQVATFLSPFPGAREELAELMRMGIIEEETEQDEG